MGFLQEIADEYRAWTPDTWWGDYTDVRFRLVEEMQTLDGRVLDAGCGSGFMISRATRAVVSGIDVCDDYLSLARKRLPLGDFRHASFHDIPWDDQSFDAVVLSHVLEIPQNHAGQLSMLVEAHRVLRDGGRLIFSTPNNDHVFYLDRKLSGHGFTRDELQNLLVLAGFSGEVRMWNPVPSCIHFLPYRRLTAIPISWWKYLHCPSWLLAHVPGIYAFLKRATDGDPRAFRSLWGTAVRA